jgi:hypothetical protein
MPAVLIRHDGAATVKVRPQPRRLATQQVVPQGREALQRNRTGPAETPQRHRATEALSKFYVVSPPPSVETDMSGTYRIERDRGIKQYRQQLAELRKKWPLAFPVHDEDIRPLAINATREIAAVMGWSYPYTLGVLSRWKMAPSYCLRAER